MLCWALLANGLRQHDACFMIQGSCSLKRQASVWCIHCVQELCQIRCLVRPRLLERMLGVLIVVVTAAHNALDMPACTCNAATTTQLTSAGHLIGTAVVTFSQIADGTCKLQLHLVAVMKQPHAHQGLRDHHLMRWLQSYDSSRPTQGLGEAMTAFADPPRKLMS